MTVSEAPATPDALLEHYAELVADEVTRSLASQEPTVLDGLVADYPNRPGKRLRPALLLATCEAFGGDPRDALPVAVSLELMHNAFLIHDDVEDGSRRRRGGPALHAQHGVPLAVHAGDALAIQAVAPLVDQSRLSVHLTRRVTREFLDTVRHTLEGQSMELAWRRDLTRPVGLEDYLRLVLHKTCWYTTIFPLRAGCLIASRASLPLDALSSFGFLIGAAFQVRDDLLDLTGDPATHGKDSLADLREGKRTLPLVHLLGVADPDEYAWITSFLGRPPADRSDEDVNTLLGLMHDRGSIATTTAWAEGLTAAAAQAFPVAFERSVSSFHAHFIEQLIGFVVDRPA